MQADLLGDPWWEMYAGISAGAGIDVEILGGGVSSFDAPDLDVYEALLADSGGPFDGFEELSVESAFPSVVYATDQNQRVVFRGTGFSASDEVSLVD